MRPHLLAANRCFLLFRPSISPSSSSSSLLPKPNNTQYASFPSRLSCVRAAHVNDPGSINLPLILSMQNKIRDHLNAESVSVKDVAGDGRHVCIEVVSAAFEGQSAVNRQRMVYKAIASEYSSCS